MKVWLKCKKINGVLLPTNINVSNALYGFDKLGIETILFEDIKDILDWVTRDDIVVSFIGDAEKVFSKYGVIAKMADYPEELHKFLNRNIGESTISALLKQDKLFGKFIKPTVQKFFTGAVVNSYSDLVKIGVKDCSIFYSDVVEIVSEYRCFIHYDKIIDIKPYGVTVGCLKGIDFNYVDALVKDFSLIKDRPNGCSIDIGIGPKGEHYLIECNDGFSLGCYGLDGILYAKLLSARWSQLMGVQDILQF